MRPHSRELEHGEEAENRWHCSKPTTNMRFDAGSCNRYTSRCEMGIRERWLEVLKRREREIHRSCLYMANYSNTDSLNTHSGSILCNAYLSISQLCATPNTKVSHLHFTTSSFQPCVTWIGIRVERSLPSRAPTYTILEPTLCSILPLPLPRIRLSRSLEACQDFVQSQFVAALIVNAGLTLLTNTLRGRSAKSC